MELWCHNSVGKCLTIHTLIWGKSNQNLSKLIIFSFFSNSYSSIHESH